MYTVWVRFVKVDWCVIVGAENWFPLRYCFYRDCETRITFLMSKHLGAILPTCKLHSLYSVYQPNKFNDTWSLNRPLIFLVAHFLNINCLYRMCFDRSHCQLNYLTVTWYISFNFWLSSKYCRPILYRVSYTSCLQLFRKYYLFT